MPEKKYVFEIPDNVEIFYPEQEREELSKCLNLNGFLRLCSQVTKVSEPTIKKYAQPEAKGQKDKIVDVMSFVKQYLQKSAA